MKITIKTKNISLTPALREFIEEKINSLEKFLGKSIIESWVEVGKETQHHRKGEIFRAECQLRIPGKSIRSESICKDLRMAVCEVKDELQRELKQYKDKRKKDKRIRQKGI